MISYLFLLFSLFLLFISIYSPALVLLFYGITGSERDALGIAGFIQLLVPEHKFLMRALLLFSFTIACIKFFGDIKNKKIHKTKIFTFVAILSSVIIVLISVMKGFDFITSLSILVYSGLPVFVIWMSTYKNIKFRKYFYVFIFVQISIASSVLMFPSLSIIDGAVYQTIEGLDGGVGANANLELPSFDSNKGDFARYGHFHNPNALGFYAGVALIIGFHFLFSKKTFLTKAIGAHFLIAGSLCWLNSLTRGPMIAVIAYISILIFFSTLNKGKISFTMKKMLISTIVLILLITVAIVNLDFLFYLIPDGESSSISSRLAGYINGVEAIALHPLLGVGPTWEWEIGLNPHFLPLFISAEHGIVVGLLVTILVFFVGFFACVKSYKLVVLQKLTKYESALCVGLILSTLSIASTNNIAATVLFWLIFAEALIRIYFPNKIH